MERALGVLLYGMGVGREAKTYGMSRHVLINSCSELKATGDSRPRSN